MCACACECVTCTQSDTLALSVERAEKWEEANVLQILLYHTDLTLPVTYSNGETVILCVRACILNAIKTVMWSRSMEDRTKAGSCFLLLSAFRLWPTSVFTEPAHFISLSASQTVKDPSPWPLIHHLSPAVWHKVQENTLFGSGQMHLDYISVTIQSCCHSNPQINSTMT